MTELVAYTRVSKDKTGAGLSVANQLGAIREWAERNGHTITETYSDNDISATTGKRRPGFEALLAQPGRDVVVWHQDRLLRVSADLERVLDAGLTVYQVQAGGTLDLTTPQGKAVARTLAAWATYEVEQKGDRQRLSNLGKVKRGEYLGRLRTFGQDVDGTLIEPEATAVREAAADLVTRAASFYSIARRWNDAGFKTPYFPPKERADGTMTPGRGGALWTMGSVHQFFLSPRLMGYQDYKGTRYKLKNWEPLLDEKTWTQIQSLYKPTGKKPGVSEKRLLSGILKCEDCGAGLTSSYRRSDNRVFYKCPTSAAHPSVSAHLADEAVKQEALSLLAMRDDAEGEAATLRDQVAELSHEIREMDKKHGAWIEEAAAAGLSVAAISAREKAHEESITKKREKLATLQTQTAVDLFRNHGQGWDTASLTQRRDLLQSLYTGITVRRVGRGSAWNPERLDFHWTDYALQLGERYLREVALEAAIWGDDYTGKPVPERRKEALERASRNSSGTV